MAKQVGHYLLETVDLDPSGLAAAVRKQFPEVPMGARLHFWIEIPEGACAGEDLDVESSGGGVSLRFSAEWLAEAESEEPKTE